MTDFVTIEKGLGPEGRIAVVRFDRRDGINALSPEALRQLTDAARSFEDDGDTSVVVLTGSATAFSAGFDLKDAEGRSRKTMDIGSLRRHLKLGPRLSRTWQEMEQINICAIEGFCIGGGGGPPRWPLPCANGPRGKSRPTAAALGRHDQADGQSSGARARRSRQP